MFNAMNRSDSLKTVYYITNKTLPRYLFSCIYATSIYTTGDLNDYCMWLSKVKNVYIKNHSDIPRSCFEDSALSIIYDIDNPLNKCVIGNIGFNGFRDADYIFNGSFNLCEDSNSSYHYHTIYNNAFNGSGLTKSEFNNMSGAINYNVASKAF